MNEQKIIEAMARADGWEVCSWNGELYKGLMYARNLGLPAYLTDANQIDRMVRGLGREFQWEYSLQLQKITTGILGGKSGAELTLNALLATAAQKCEAYLKALGKWEEG